MEKNRVGMSWFTLVKKAFKSPNKDNPQKKGSKTRDNENEDQEDQKKVKGKKRWLFRRSNIHVQHSKVAKTNTDETCSTSPVKSFSLAEPRHAIAVEAGTSAALATAQAQIVRHVGRTPPNSFVKELHYAATLIQTVFRGFMARRALIALKGVVKLQALVRGQNVRKQTKLTLKCMEALVRVQDQVRYQRARLSLESSRKSMFAETSGFFTDARCLEHIFDRKSISRETSRGTDFDWDDRPHKIEEIEASLHNKNEAALKRERALAYAFSHQIWKPGTKTSGIKERELEDRIKWLERWMANKEWEKTSIEKRSAESIKRVQIDPSCRTRSGPGPGPTVVRKSQSQLQQAGPHGVAVALPVLNHSPFTPSPSNKVKYLKVRSASPRCPKEERCYSAAQTPSLLGLSGSGGYGGVMPSYMAATESAKAKAQARSQSTPRNSRPCTPERERGSAARKRLSYPVLLVPNEHRNSFSHTLTSPSFKSVQNYDHYNYNYGSGVENLSSCYADSTIGRDISPCSTTDLRWFK